MASYDPPLALTILAAIFIGVAALTSFWILLDIVLRRGWRTMMAIMIPVYTINALYLAPLTLWTYLKYGRPKKFKSDESIPTHAAHHPPHGRAGGQTEQSHATEAGGEANGHTHPSHGGHEIHSPSTLDEETLKHHDSKAEGDQMMAHGSHQHGGDTRPMFATLTVAVCHCGAGCVLGDVIGEWIVYGANITIDGKRLWAEYVIDFGFAIFFGIFFQYFSIAPMAGVYGPNTLWRAAKADILSLVFFEIGLFGWMAIFQVAIFNWRLEMNNVVYWWMMQIGMFCGHWTAVPINYWLIKWQIKEPCA